jgi:hypothetical protein
MLRLSTDSIKKVNVSRVGVSSGLTDNPVYRRDDGNKQYKSLVFDASSVNTTCAEGGVFTTPNHR